MTAYVLVHGAFRGGWAWSRVTPLLEAAGHSADAPDLTGAGDRFDGQRDVTLDDWVRDVVDVITGRDLRDVVLVGHSQGGVVTTAASHVVPERIARLVHLDAAVPDDGQCAADLLPAQVQARFGPPPPLTAWVPARPTGDPWVDERLRPTPVRPAYDRVTLDDPAALAIPRTYAFCGLSLDAMPDTTPAHWLRRRLDATGVAYDVLDADHDAPLTAPRLVADLLLTPGRTSAGTSSAEA